MHSAEPFRTGAAVVDRRARGTLAFTGPQARWFLDQLVTNRVLELPTGAGADSLLLTPSGRITAVLRLWAAGDEQVLADLDPGAAERVGPFFAGRVFATRVTVEDRSDDVALVSVLGPSADEVVAAAVAALDGEAPLPAGAEHANAWATAGGGQVLLARVTRPVAGLDLVVPAALLDPVLEALAGAGGVATPEERLVERLVVAGVPRFGVDFDERFLPQEAAFERAVHFGKGCYLGQEAVAMAQRGRVKRRLRHLAFEGRPVTGQAVHDSLPVGEVTSIAEDDGSGWGIGTIRTSVPVGATVTVTGDGGEEARAEVAELPGSSEAPKPPSARELRERLAGSPEPPGRRGGGRR
jgi:folate-binding protein YgfZ